MPWVEAAAVVAGEGVAAEEAVVVVGTVVIQPAKAAGVSCSEQTGCNSGRVQCVSD